MSLLNEIYTDWYNNEGIFSDMEDSDLPWYGIYDSRSLDIAYHGNRSGEKEASPLLETMYESDMMDEIPPIIKALYLPMWVRQWETIDANYDPLSDYDITESLTNDTEVTTYGKVETLRDSGTRAKTGTEKTGYDVTDTDTGTVTDEKTGTDTETPNITRAKSGDDTVTHNTTDTRTPSLSQTTNNSVYAFNSSSAVNSDTQTGTQTGTETLTKTGTDKTDYGTSERETGTRQTTYNTKDTETNNLSHKKAGDETVTYNVTDTDNLTHTNTNSGSDTKTRSHTLHKSGHYGKTTFQESIEAERRVNMWHFFEDVVFPDVDKVLTVQVY